MINDYFGAGETIKISAPTTVDSDGVQLFGTPVTVGARVQFKTLTIHDGQGNSIGIDATVYTDYTVPQDLGAKVEHDGQVYRIATRRVYRDIDGPSHQTFFLERMAT